MTTEYSVLVAQYRQGEIELAREILTEFTIDRAMVTSERVVPDFEPLVSGPLAVSGEPIKAGKAVERRGRR